MLTDPPRLVFGEQLGRRIVPSGSSSWSASASTVQPGKRDSVTSITERMTGCRIMRVGKFGETTHEDAASRYRLRDSCGFHLTSVRPSVLPEQRRARSLRVRQF